MTLTDACDGRRVGGRNGWKAPRRGLGGGAAAAVARLRASAVLRCVVIGWGLVFVLWQGLTPAHFSAQPEPVSPLTADANQRIPQKAITSSWKSGRVCAPSLWSPDLVSDAAFGVWPGSSSNDTAASSI
jgi:hypothetical protein